MHWSIREKKGNVVSKINEKSFFTLAMRRIQEIIPFLVCLLFLLPQHVRASKYSPPGLYDTEHVVLENGLQVVLNVQEGAHNASFRLVVMAGTLDFPHGKREIPHFLEHLLFSGTSKHTEEELEALVKSFGGRWNAGTGDRVTTYEMDLYSGYAVNGLYLLHEIVTDSQLKPEKVEVAREILLREMGGRPSNLKKWLYRRGIGKSAFEKAYEALLPGEEYRRDRIETAEDISREEILEAYRRYYVPDNMILIVVGEFERDKLIKRIQATFGEMRPGKARKRNGEIPPYTEGPVEVSGIFSPIVGTDATVGIMFRTEGKGSSDYAPLWVLGEYLDRRMYEHLRIQKGLAYSPGAWFSAKEDYGVFHIVADVDIDKTSGALLSAWEVIEEISGGKVEPKDLEKVKMDLLLGMTRAYQTNSDKADYYAGVYYEAEDNGKFTNDEDLLEKVTPKDVVSAAKKYLRTDRAISFINEPTITYTKLISLIVVIIIFLLLLVLFLLRRQRRRKKRRKGLDFEGLVGGKREGYPQIRFSR